MKKKLLTLSALLLLSGCSFFQTPQDPVSSTHEETSEQSGQTITETKKNTEQETENERTFEELQHLLESEEKERTGVFNEEELDESHYPKSTLALQDFNGTYSDLDQAINDYYEQELTEQEKENNWEKILPSDLESLQNSFKRNDLLKPLEAEVDQVIINLGGKPNYIARVIVAMSYDAASKIKKDHDILLLNEALSHLGNRLVLLEYYDPDTDTLTPFHLANSSNSLFSNNISNE